MARRQTTYLSGYRLMWVMVLFDLPVGDRAQRRTYTRFRNFLLDQGFERVQFSVYVRHLSGKEAVSAIAARIQDKAPKDGHIDILQFTDKQYENIISIRGAAVEPRKNPEQYVLFE